MAQNVEQQVDKIFKHLAKELTDLSPVLATLGEVAVSGIQENFRAGGRTGAGPYGGGTTQWPKSARVLNKGGQTLIDTGLLVGSIAYRAESPATLVLTAGPRPGAELHNFGGVINAKNAPFLVFRPYKGAGIVRKKSVKIPARPYMTLTDEDIQELLDTLVDFYNQLIGP